MPTFDELDAITTEQLRAAGGLRWIGPDGEIGAFIAEMDYGVAPEIIAGLQQEVGRARLGYQPAALLRRMREATSRYLGEHFSWEVDPGSVHAVPDVIAGIVAAIEHYSRPGSAVVVPTPAYMPFLTIPRSLGREVIEVPMLDEAGRWRMDVAAIAAAFDAGGGLLLLCNPHNPTGRVFTAAELREVADVVEAKGGRVFADEIWAPLIFDGQRHVPYASVGPAAAGHAITAISASKTWNVPGLKCAQVILTNDRDRAEWARSGDHVEHEVANLGLVGTAIAYDAGWPWRSDVVAYLERNWASLAAFVADRLPDVGLARAEGTYVAWLDFSAYGLDGGPAPYLARHAHVTLTDGPRCGEVGRDHARLIYAMPRPVLLEALERIAVALGR